MRILIYGGCHAAVIRDILQNMLSPDAVHFSVLINFELIHAGTPFPYQQLIDIDCVIFSHIENKGEYNTTRLVNYCRQSGVKTLSFPWLEWHGYTPGATKGVFGHRYQWYYPELEQLASSFGNFWSFHDFVLSSFPNNETLISGIERTTEMLLSMEERNATDIKIADFAKARHRDSRLFLIPDHPSLSVYMHVVYQIIELLDLGSLIVGSYDKEPQPELRIPIFPKVAQWLGLDFCDTVWIDTDRLPKTTATLTTYLQQYFYKPSFLLVPLAGATFLGEPEEVPLHTRLLVRLVERPSTTGQSEYLLVETLSGRPPANAEFAVNDSEWSTT